MRCQIMYFWEVVHITPVAEQCVQFRDGKEYGRSHPSSFPNGLKGFPRPLNTDCQIAGFSIVPDH